MPEPVFSMSSDLFLIMTASLASALCSNNASERTFTGNYSSSVFQRLCLERQIKSLHLAPALLNLHTS